MQQHGSFVAGPTDQWLQGVPDSFAARDSWASLQTDGAQQALLVGAAPPPPLLPLRTSKPNFFLRGLGLQSLQRELCKDPAAATAASWAAAFFMFPFRLLRSSSPCHQDLLRCGVLVQG